MGSRTVLAAVAALLLAHPAAAEGMYDPIKSQVKNIIADSYDNVVARSKHVTMLEFYAPWCGHCQNLKPAYEKAATSLVGLGNVAAVNCDDDENKPLCAKFEVKGFPTLKIIKPSKKVGKPFIEDYNGPRTAQGIVDAVIEKIPNFVKKVKGADFDSWLVDNKHVKIVVFSDKGKIAPSLKSLAIDYQGIADIAQVASSEKKLVKKYGIKKFPTLIGFPEFAKDKDPQVYDGEMKKFDMAGWIAHLNSPSRHGGEKNAKQSNYFNAAAMTSQIEQEASRRASIDSAWSASQAASASKSTAETKIAAKSKKASASKKATPSQTQETLEEQGPPTESPDPKVIPEDTALPVEDASEPTTPPIPILQDETTLQQKCLNTESGTCVLALLSKDLAGITTAFDAVTSLGRVHQKHETAKRKLFPFFQLPPGSPDADKLRKELGLGDDTEIIAINSKRSWFRRYAKADYGVAALEDWIDSIRMGDGAKDKVPKGLIVDASTLPQEPKESPKVDTNDPIAMAEALRSQLPEGVELELEEIDTDEYERILAESKKNAPPKEDKAEHKVDEL